MPEENDSNNETEANTGSDIEGLGKCEVRDCGCQQFVRKSGSAFQWCTCGHRDVDHKIT